VAYNLTKIANRSSGDSCYPPHQDRLGEQPAATEAISRPQKTAASGVVKSVSMMETGGVYWVMTVRESEN
jgi:hypothetical protein